MLPFACVFTEPVRRPPGLPLFPAVRALPFGRPGAGLAPPFPFVRTGTVARLQVFLLLSISVGRVCSLPARPRLVTGLFDHEESELVRRCLLGFFLLRVDRLLRADDVFPSFSKLSHRFSPEPLPDGCFCSPHPPWAVPVPFFGTLAACLLSLPRDAGLSRGWMHLCSLRAATLFLPVRKRSDCFFIFLRCLLTTAIVY